MDEINYDFGLELNGLDKIITLSTCNNNLGQDKRSVVHAKLVRMIDYNSELLRLQVHWIWVRVTAPVHPPTWNQGIRRHLVRS